MAQINKEELHGEWIHSSEEDTADEKVFRPANYDFPLTRRPRESFQLEPDGNLIKGEASASDSVQQTRGKWDVKGDKIAFYDESNSESKQTSQIASIKGDKLVLKK